MATLDHLDIVNAACALLAADPLEGLDDETPGAQSAAALYFEVADFCLAMAPWSFARRTVQLGLLDGVVSNLGFNHVHQLPAELIGAPERLLRDPRLNASTVQAYDYDEERRVHSDWDPLYAQGTVRVTPGLWHPAFRMAVIHAAAAVLAEPLTGNSGMAETLHAKAFGTPSEAMRGGLMRAALNADGRVTPSRALPSHSNPLLAAWRGGWPNDGRP
jgi:hypothetical protein